MGGGGCGFFWREAVGLVPGCAAVAVAPSPSPEFGVGSQRFFEDGVVVEPDDGVVDDAEDAVFGGGDVVTELEAGDDRTHAQDVEQGQEEEGEY